MSKYTELITNYHATKPKFLAHVDLMTRPLIDVAAATSGLITAFDIDSAVGVQLDILGLWIGRSRVVSQPISGVYFSLDTDGLGYDQGVWQGPYDPDSGYMYLSDETYRVILKAKIAINNWDGRNDSLPAILDAATAGWHWIRLPKDRPRNRCSTTSCNRRRHRFHPCSCRCPSARHESLRASGKACRPRCWNSTMPQASFRTS